MKISVGVEQFLLEYTKLNITGWHTSCWRTWEVSEIRLLKLNFFLFIPPYHFPMLINVLHNKCWFFNQLLWPFHWWYSVPLDCSWQVGKMGHNPGKLFIGPKYLTCICLVGNWLKASAVLNLNRNCIVFFHGSFWGAVWELRYNSSCWPCGPQHWWKLFTVPFNLKHFY